MEQPRQALDGHDDGAEQPAEAEAGEEQEQQERAQSPPPQQQQEDGEREEEERGEEEGQAEGGEQGEAPEAEPQQELDENKAVEFKKQGNEAYQNKALDEAVDLYTRGIAVCPDGDTKAQLLGNRAACEMARGRHDAAVQDCTAALEIKPDYLKVLQRRCRAHEATDNLAKALEDAKAAVALDPGCTEMKAMVVKLEPVVRERQEREKEEMLGKLKDLGNTLLGKFGLSTDNFKMQQDPNTGSYNISFQK